MRAIIEKHIVETILFRTGLKEIPKEMYAQLSTGFDGSGKAFKRVIR